MKFAEMSPQPRSPASRAMYDDGLIAETASGGCGFWYGFSIGPMQDAAATALSIVMSQYLPGMR